MKIVNIDIKAFRLFKDVFVDFSSTKDSSKAANFVAIYAPNGFGKTSLFDAVEFCVTKSIHRVSTNFKENYNNDQKLSSLTYIHNKELPDTPLSVTMNFEDRSPLSVCCTPSEECNFFKSESTVENKYFRDVILSQDWLTEFLSSKNAADRFKIFMANFDETKELIEYYKSLSSTLHVLSTRIKKKNQVLLDLSKQIDRKLNDGVWLLLDKKCNELLVIGLDLSLDGRDESKIDQTKAKTSVCLLNLKDNVNSLRGILNNLDKVLLGDDEYIQVDAMVSSFAQLKELKKSCLVLSKKLNSIKKLKEGEEQLLNYKSLLSNISEQRMSFMFLVNHSRLFQSIYRYVFRINSLTTRLQKDKVELNTAIVQYKNKLIQLSSDIESIALLKDQNAQLLKDLHGKYEKYNELKRKCDLLVKERLTIEKYLNEYKERNIQLGEKHSQLLSFKLNLQLDNYRLLTGFFEEDVAALINQIEVISLRIREKEELENTIKAKQAFSDNLQALLASSHDIISKLKGSKCPLCGFDYEEHSNLLNAISSNSVIETSVSNDIAKKAKLDLDILKAKTSLANSKKNLLDAVSDLLSKLVSEQSYLLNEQKMKNDELTRVLQQENDIDALLKREYINCIECTEEENIQKYQSLSIKYQHEIQSLESVKGEYQKKLQSAEGRVTNIYARIAKCESKVKLWTESSFYTKYAELSQSEFPSEEKVQHWVNMLLSLDNESCVIQQKIDAIDKQRDDYRLEGVSLEDELLLKQQYDSQFAAYQVLYTSWQKTIKFLKQECGLTLSFKLQDIEALIRSIYDYQASVINKLKNEDAKIVLINEYYQLLELSEKFLENEKKKSNHDALRAEIEKIKSNLNIIQQEKQRLQTYLKEFVDGFFQLDLINKLYNTIDPHPDYKKIQFECDFRLKDPRLNVLMYSEDESNTIVPNLYLSTAQINILSFCIFLAKAIFAKDDDGNSLNCVFVDDPIQALDDINILSLIDMLRNVAFALDKQIVLTTHNRDFFELLKLKVPDNLFNSRFIKFESRGVV